MSALSIVVKAAAAGDVENIAEYIAFDSERSAERFRNEFKAALERIRQFPKLGYAAPAPYSILRLTRVSERFDNYLILYRYRDDGVVQIIRVFHGAVDIRTWIAKSDLS